MALYTHKAIVLREETTFSLAKEILFLQMQHPLTSSLYIHRIYRVGGNKEELGVSGMDAAILLSIRISNGPICHKLV